MIISCLTVVLHVQIKNIFRYQSIYYCLLVGVCSYIKLILIILMLKNSLVNYHLCKASSVRSYRLYTAGDMPP